MTATGAAPIIPLRTVETHMRGVRQYCRELGPEKGTGFFRSRHDALSACRCPICRGQIFLEGFSESLAPFDDRAEAYRRVQRATPELLDDLTALPLIWWHGFETRCVNGHAYAPPSIPHVEGQPIGTYSFGQLLLAGCQPLLLLRARAGGSMFLWEWRRHAANGTIEVALDAARAA